MFEAIFKFYEDYIRLCQRIYVDPKTTYNEDILEHPDYKHYNHVHDYFRNNGEDDNFMYWKTYVKSYSCGKR